MERGHGVGTSCAMVGRRTKQKSLTFCEDDYIFLGELDDSDSSPLPKSGMKRREIMRILD